MAEIFIHEWNKSDGFPKQVNKFLQPAKTRIWKMAFGYMTYAITTQTQDGKTELIGKMSFIGRILINLNKISYETDRQRLFNTVFNWHG